MESLAEELAAVRDCAQQAHQGNLDHVDAILARLQHARTHLVSPRLSPPPPEPASARPPALDEGQSSPGDHLLPLSSFLKSSNAQSAQLHKDWASALSRLAKAADKARLTLSPSCVTRLHTLTTP